MSAIPSKALGVVSGFFSDGPWRSKSVLASLAAVMVGGGFWFSDVENDPPQDAASTAVSNGPGGAPNEMQWDWSRPLPFYVPACGSYVVGFCIGWFFRKLIRIVVVVAALVIALLAFGRFAGCDTKPAQERVKRSSEWAQREAAEKRDYLLHLLPSATGGGVGIFLGFRSRRKAMPANPPS